MRKLRNSLPIRVGAWLLFLVMVSGAVFFGLQCVRGIQCQGADDARETSVFSQMVEEREQQVLELLSCQLQLKDNTLDYVARQTCQARLEQLGKQLDPGQTNFRYQVLSADGSQVLLGDLGEQSGLEALVSQIYYLRLSASGVGQMALESEVIPEFSAVETEGALIYSTPAAGAAEEMVVLRCGVLRPEQMEAQDEFLSLEQEFARCQKNFAFYLTLALSFAAAAAGLLFFLLWASGHRPEGESYVYADGRHLWRVIDNLLSNCAKYALEGTRVYIELVRGKGSVSLSVKNISREALNVPPERLMERFVRGEESRSTEGPGLGLSIARSLTELQGGTFELAVDGDLFKAVVTLPQSS